MVKNTSSLDPDPEEDPDSDFWLDPVPDSMNMDLKHWTSEGKIFVELGMLCHNEPWETAGFTAQ